MPINFDHTGNLIVTNDGLLTFEITGAVRVPVGTTAQRPASPASGMLRYNTTLNTFEGYTSSWQDLLAGGGGGGGGASVTVSDTAPVGPSDGDLWYRTTDPIGMYMWYAFDSVWIMVAGAALVIDETEFGIMFDNVLATKPMYPVGGSTDRVFWENDQVVTTDYTITSGKNAMSAGPITINSGITVTVGTGESWAIV